jgi:lipoyl-dependent peroxiredoxin
VPVRNASAIWRGNLKDGKGSMKLGSGAFEGNYSFASRFENGQGTNPEELIGAAHAGCFSMALSHILAENGFEPKEVKTSAKVKIEKVEEGFKITSIELETEAQVPKISRGKFMQYAEDAKQNCPVSQALAGTDITLKANLAQQAVA